MFDRWVAQGEGRSLVMVRPVVIFGEGNQGNVANLIKQISGGKFFMVGDGTNKKSMGYVGNLVQFLVHAIDLSEGKHLFNYADKPDMVVAELVSHIRSELGIRKPLPRLPYSLVLMGGYAFDVFARLTGKRFPISSIRIKKFCANTTVSTLALESIGFKPAVSLKEGLSLMMGSMIKESS